MQKITYNEQDGSWKVSNQKAPIYVLDFTSEDIISQIFKAKKRFPPVEALEITQKLQNYLMKASPREFVIKSVTLKPALENKIEVIHKRIHSQDYCTLANVGDYIVFLDDETVHICSKYVFDREYIREEI